MHLLIQALAEDGDDPEAMTVNYLDGTSIQRYQPIRDNSLSAKPPGGKVMSAFMGSARETQIASVRVRRGWFGKLVVQVRYKIERPGKPDSWPGTDLPRMRTLPMARR
ncbi:hypothetical protein ACPA9J_15835 [Pseudomonas aeruginosa]